MPSAPESVTCSAGLSETLQAGLGETRTTISALRIGPLALDFPVVQAALSGYSDWAMRVIARRLDAPYTLCEVMLDQLVLQGGKKTQRFMKVTDEEHPVGGQLMGA